MNKGEFIPIGKGSIVEDYFCLSNPCMIPMDDPNNKVTEITVKNKFEITTSFFGIQVYHYYTLNEIKFDDVFQGVGINTVNLSFKGENAFNHEPGAKNTNFRLNPNFGNQKKSHTLRAYYNHVVEIQDLSVFLPTEYPYDFDKLCESIKADFCDPCYDSLNVTCGYKFTFNNLMNHDLYFTYPSRTGLEKIYPVTDNNGKRIIELTAEIINNAGGFDKLSMNIIPRQGRRFIGEIIPDISVEKIEE